MHIAACQFDIAWEDRAANHAKVRDMLARANMPAGSLVTLPEMFATGFSMDVGKIAENEDPATTRFLAQAAQDFGIYLLAGLVTRAPDGRGMNQALAFDPLGAEVCRYTKIHPFTFGKEGDHYTAGQQVQRFEWAGAFVSPFVCYDLRFPEVFREGARQGAQVLAIIANWPAAREDHWLTLLRARAIENQAYVVGVNRCGRDPNVDYAGHSLIVGPRGELLAEAGSGEEVISADVDLPALAAYRQRFPALRDMKWPL